MAHTTPTDYRLTEQPSPARVRDLFDVAKEQYERALGDSDKACDPNDVNYYEGWVDALAWVLEILTGKDDPNDVEG